jgi:hypothetical protein
MFSFIESLILVQLKTNIFWSFLSKSFCFIHYSSFLSQNGINFIPKYVLLFATKIIYGTYIVLYTYFFHFFPSLHIFLESGINLRPSISLPASRLALSLSTPKLSSFYFSFLSSTFFLLGDASKTGHTTKICFFPSRAFA